MQYVDRSRVLPPPSLVTDNIVKENLYDIGAFLGLESQRRAQTRPPRLASLSVAIQIAPCSAQLPEINDNRITQA